MKCFTTYLRFGRCSSSVLGNLPNKTLSQYKAEGAVNDSPEPDHCFVHSEILSFSAYRLHSMPPILTQVARAADALPLVATSTPTHNLVATAEHQQDAKKLMRSMTTG